MLINSNGYYKISNIIYDEILKTSSCIFSMNDINDNIISTEQLSWKGEDYFLSSENLLNTNAVSLIYNKLYSSTKYSWLYDATEDIIFGMPKIYKYINKNISLKHFHDIDYTIELNTKLYPKRTFVKGELQIVEWFFDVECTDAILRVETVYNRDSLGFALSRQTVRSWYNNDNQLNSNKKITDKNYTINSIDQTIEGVRRRGNIIKSLQMPILGLMIATISDKTDMEVIEIGRDFLKSHKVSFQSFIDESHKGILIDITNATDYWLDNIINVDGITIRQYILSELDISI